MCLCDCVKALCVCACVVCVVVWLVSIYTRIVVGCVWCLVNVLCLVVNLKHAQCNICSANNTILTCLFVIMMLLFIYSPNWSSIPVIWVLVMVFIQVLLAKLLFIEHRENCTILTNQYVSLMAIVIIVLSINFNRHIVTISSLAIS